jgi:hypothetical protein
MKKSLLAMTAMAMMLIAACKKTDNNPSNVVPVGSYATIADVYSAARNQPVYQVMDAGTGGSFYGNSGTRYIFQPGSFMDSAGNVITGSVQIVATEYLKKGDMIFSKMLPLSDSNALFSGGELSISANQGGTKLYLRPGYSFQANMPQGGTPLSGMSFFSGMQAKDTTVNTVNWHNVDSIHGSGGIIYNGDTISIISDSLKVCNADQFMPEPVDFQSFTVTITVTGATLPSGATVEGYVLFDNYKAVWPLGWISGYSNGVFSEQHTPNIPVHFAVYTLINNDFYAGVVSATPASGKNYTVNLTKTDPVSFKGQLNVLTD